MQYFQKFYMFSKFSFVLFFLLPSNTNTFLSPPTKVMSNHKLYANGDKSYELKLGKTIDILQHDYESIFKNLPNFDIYTEDITLQDPTGVRVKGLAVYRHLLEMMHNIANLFIKDSTMDYKFYYKPENKKITIQWKLQINFRLRKLPFYVEANSYYGLDKDAQIYSHIIDKLIVNDQSITPPYNIPVQYLHFFEKKPAKTLIPVFFFEILMKKWFSLCKTNQDCNFPLTCCNYSLFNACCNEGGTPKSTYPHPYFKRPIRIRVEEEKYPSLKL